ncbi:MAG: hypothetical protein ABR915_01820 [Thermoguttaceae bacterium]|jgi:hypothetical protein
MASLPESHTCRCHYAVHVALLAGALLSTVWSWSSARGHDWMRDMEDQSAWCPRSFQGGGYGHPPGPDSFNKQIYQGFVEIVLDRDVACARIDRAFRAAGYKMVRDYAYDRDGVAFRATGYDPDKKVGYVWATPETVGPGFFGNDRESPNQNPDRLSAAKAAMLEKRAPITLEFIAVVIPYTSRLGYVTGYYRNAEEKAAFEKRKADTVEERLTALDSCVAEYVCWVADRRASEYPSRSPKPRNLLSLARWRACPRPHHSFGECGVGQPRPLPAAMLRKFVERLTAEAKIDVTSPFRYERNGTSLTITGFDPRQKIGYVWGYPNDEPPSAKELEVLAAQAEADGICIAWISPADKRFDRSGYPVLTRYAPRYLEKVKESQAIADPASREAALRALDEQIEEDNARPALDKLERRLREFLDWAKN